MVEPATVSAGIAAFTTFQNMFKSVLDPQIKELIDKRKAQNSLDSFDLRNLYNKIRQITIVKTLFRSHEAVSLYDFYYPARLKISSPNTDQHSQTFPSAKSETHKTIAPSSLADIPTHRNCVIEGTVGQGKSILLRYLCGQELSAKSSKRIPIFIELRKISTTNTLDKLIADALDNFGLPKETEAFGVLAQSKRFVLLLDAFDEIHLDCVEPTIHFIENLCQKYQGSLQIIITSRPNAGIQNLPYFATHTMVPITSDDHLPILKSICEHSEDGIALAQKIQDTIHKSSTDIKNLITTPLMMSLLKIVYEAEQEIPENVPKFYDALFNVLFRQHDNSKANFKRARYTALSDDEIKKLFSTFCFVVRSKNLGSLNQDDFQSCFQDAVKYAAINKQIDSATFKDEIIKTTCLMLEDGFDVSFIHKSVAEYHAALFIKNSSVGVAQKFYSHVLQSLSTERNEQEFRFAFIFIQELRFLEIIDDYKYYKYFGIYLLQELISNFTSVESVIEFVTSSYDLSFSISKEGIKIPLWVTTYTINKFYIAMLLVGRLPEHHLTALKDYYYHDIKSNPDKYAPYNNHNTKFAPPKTELESILRIPKHNAKLALALQQYQNLLQTRLQAANKIIQDEESKSALLDNLFK